MRSPFTYYWMDGKSHSLLFAFCVLWVVLCIVYAHEDSRLYFVAFWAPAVIAAQSSKYLNKAYAHSTEEYYLKKSL